MIRGLVSAECLLVWRIEEGWDPICKFLGKEVPEEEFPSGNQGPVFFERIRRYMEERMRRAYRNLFVCAPVAGVGFAAVGYQFLPGLMSSWRALRR